MRNRIIISGELTEEYGRQICREIYSCLPSKVTENVLEILIDSKEGEYEVFFMIKERIEELKKYDLIVPFFTPEFVTLISPFSQSA